MRNLRARKAIKKEIKERQEEMIALLTEIADHTNTSAFGTEHQGKLDELQAKLNVNRTAPLQPHHTYTTSDERDSIDNERFEHLPPNTDLRNRFIGVCVCHKKVITPENMDICLVCFAVFCCSDCRMRNGHGDGGCRTHSIIKACVAYGNIANTDRREALNLQPYTRLSSQRWQNITAGLFPSEAPAAIIPAAIIPAPPIASSWREPTVEPGEFWVSSKRLKAAEAEAARAAEAASAAEDAQASEDADPNAEPNTANTVDESNEDLNVVKVTDIDQPARENVNIAVEPPEDLTPDDETNYPNSPVYWTTRFRYYKPKLHSSNNS
jgi:hypothetical protein